VLQQPLRRQHLERQPHGPGGRRVVGVAREDQLLGPHQPDPAGQPLGAAEARHQPELHLRLAEPGLLAGVDQVAGHGQLAPAAEGEAVHGGDGDERQRLQGRQRPVAQRREGPRLVRRHLRHGRDVGAGHEGLLAAAGQDQGPCLGRARRHPGQRLAELAQRAGVQGVQLLGPVDGHGGHAVGHLQPQVLEGHRAHPPYR
jgi:hypothetical protein